MFTLKKLAWKAMSLACFFIIGLALTPIQAAPPPLTDAQLDRISAGYVDLELNGRATATGPKAVATFSSSTEQSSNKSETGDYTYTTITSSVDAYAKGRKVTTEVGYSFETDEEVLSFDVSYKEKSSSKKRNNKRNNKRKTKTKPKTGNKTTRERKRLTITVVTRTNN